MSTQNFNLLNNIKAIPDTTNMRFGIVVSEWNNNITDILLEGAIETLKANGVDESNITVSYTHK